MMVIMMDMMMMRYDVDAKNMVHHYIILFAPMRNNTLNHYSKYVFPCRYAKETLNDVMYLFLLRRPRITGEKKYKPHARKFRLDFTKQEKNIT